VEQVQRGDVEGGRHPNGRAAPHQALGEVQPGISVEEATVDVGRGDVDQLGRVGQLGQLDDHAHGELAGRAFVARQHRPVGLAQPHAQTLP
jgi:hypothetical protein